MNLERLGRMENVTSQEGRPSHWPAVMFSPIFSLYRSLQPEPGSSVPELLTLGALAGIGRDSAITTSQREALRKATQGNCIEGSEGENQMVVSWILWLKGI